MNADENGKNKGRLWRPFSLGSNQKIYQSIGLAWKAAPHFFGL
jgi:hypothetical protein